MVGKDGGRSLKKLLKANPVLRLIQNSEIDRDWWDELISLSSSNDPYPYSWYLDIMSPGWKALVNESDQIIMPLAVKNKAFVNYVYTPYFIQKLGLYSKANVPDSKKESFFDFLKGNFSLVDISVPEKPGVLYGNTSPRSNYKLNIKDSYKNIYKGYTSDCRRNIRRSDECGLETVGNVRPEDAVKLFIEGPGSQITGIRKGDYLRLIRLMEYCCSSGKGNIIGLTKNGRLIYSLFYTKYSGQLTTLFTSTSKESKICRSGYYALNKLISEFAESSFVLDFAGSSLGGVESFIRSFGSEKEEYYRFFENNLTFPLKQVYRVKNKHLKR